MVNVGLLRMHSSSSCFKNFDVAFIVKFSVETCVIGELEMMTDAKNCKFELAYLS